MNLSKSLPCVLLLLGSALSAQVKTTRIRGTVQDANTRQPIAGATVSTSGNTAQQGEITDDNGFFRLVISGVAPGDLVRIRVVKPGYIVYDAQIVTSEEIPITVPLRRSGSAARPAPTTPAARPAPKPLVSSDPVTARYIQVMTTETNPLIRLNALNVIVKNAAQDPAALAAIVAAVNDADYRVRQQAVVDLGWVGKPTPEVLVALRIALDDPERLVRVAAIHALAKFPHDKSAVDTLIQTMGTPPHIDADATMTLHNAGVDDPRILTALVYEATQRNDKNAAAALGQDAQKKGTVDALFAALGTPPKINVSAMNILKQMGVDDPRLTAAFVYEATENKDDAAIATLGHNTQDKVSVDALFATLGSPPNINLSAMNILQRRGVDDPRLISALIYEATEKKSDDAITALGHYPQNKNAVEALLSILGAPPAINNTAMATLCSIGVDDPRLSQILVDNANSYPCVAPAVSLLLKRGPLSGKVIASLVRDVALSLDSPENYRAQVRIMILLQAGGAPGRKALHQLLSASDPQPQGLLTLAWLEIDHNAIAEILPYLHLPRTYEILEQTAELDGNMSVTVALPEYDSSPTPCKGGPSLRALMGLSMLDLHLANNYDSLGVSPRKFLIDLVSSGRVCSAYVAAVLPWLGPTVLNDASAKLIHNARCYDNLDQKAATDTLSLLGTQDTIAQLQAQNHLANCDKSDPKAPGFNPQDDLIARIQARLDAR